MDSILSASVQHVRHPFYLLAFWGALCGLAQAQNSTAPASSQRTVSYVMPDGTLRTMLAQADADEDGVTNELEIDGYYYCRREGVMLPATETCDGVLPDVWYKTDPDRWSTDGDPYSDFTEVSGVNMHPAVTVPENHPLVAASPVIVVQMPTYTVIPNGEITDTEGGSRSDAMTQEASVSVEVGYSETVEAEVGVGGLGASASATVSMSTSASYTESSTVTNEVNWSRARSVNPSEAAYLSLGVFFENRGSAPILDLTVQFNLVLGDKVIATITPDLTVNSLAPGQRFPDASAPYVVVERDISNNPIALTLDELKLVQLGAPLSLVVTQVDGKIGRWNSDTQSFDNDVNWSSWSANIEPVVVNLHADLGDGETYLYKIYAGTAAYDPGLTFKDIVSLVFAVQESDGKYSIEGRPYPGDWFLTSPSKAVQDEWEARSRPQNIMELPMHRNTVISMKSPGSQPGPRINLATFTPDFRHVLVNASARTFPILSARAEVMVDGQAQNVTLVKDGAFYRNADPFASPADVDAKVFVEDAKGDVAEAHTVLPAFYTSAQDVVDFSNFLSVPGGDEYLLFLGGDTTRPGVIYCDFSFAEGGQDVVGKEYLTLATSDSTNFSDDPTRVFFNKIRLDPNSLEVNTRDLTFSDAPGEEFEVARYGYSSLSCSEHSGNIDLRGVPFHLDPFAEFEGDQLSVDPLRKLVDWYGGSPQSCVTGGVSGPLKLAYDEDAPDLAIQDGLAGGGSLYFNATASQDRGHVTMGSGASLAVSDAITLEAWVKPELASGEEERTQAILNREGEYEIFRWVDGTIRWAIANGSPGWVTINTYYRATLDEWVHVALTYDRNAENGAIKTYINGRLFHGRYGSGAIGDFSQHENQDEFWVGSRQAFPQDAFDGLIDEVRVWNVARSEQQIRAAMVDTLGPEVYADPNSGLIGYWRFDRLEDLGVGGDGADDVRDYSLNGDHGDLVGEVVPSEIATVVDESTGKIPPERFVLHQNYPNPFNPSTRIAYELPRAGYVELTVYNMLGKKIRTLVQGGQGPGSKDIEWDGRSDNGIPVASGIYLCRLQVGTTVLSRKMLMLK